MFSFFGIRFEDRATTVVFYAFGPRSCSNLKRRDKYFLEIDLENISNLMIVWLRSREAKINIYPVSEIHNRRANL